MSWLSPLTTLELHALINNGHPTCINNAKSLAPVYTSKGLPNSANLSTGGEDYLFLSSLKAWWQSSSHSWDSHFFPKKSGKVVATLGKKNLEWSCGSSWLGQSMTYHFLVKGRFHSWIALTFIISVHILHLSPHSSRTQYLVEQSYFVVFGGNCFEQPIGEYLLVVTNNPQMWFGESPSFLASPWVHWSCSNRIWPLCAYLSFGPLRPNSTWLILP
jgi:hypothetical protein